MFSKRTAWDRTANRLAAILEARRGRGEPVLDLTETNPTRAGLPSPADLLAPLADPGGLHYEPMPLGLPEAREAVAADYRRRGLAVEAGQVLLTASTSEAYGLLFKLLCDPGDEVLVPRPSYPLFEYLARLESVEVRPYPLHYDGEWHLEPDGIRGEVSPRTRAVVVVHPNNPTGSFLKRDEADALRRLGAECSLALVSDEVFADYGFGDDPRRASSLAEGGPALTFALGGLSKSCGLPQLKLAWVVVAGPEPSRREALDRLEIVADTYLSVSTPVQRAAPALLARLPELQRPIARRTAANLDTLRTRVAGTPVTLLPPEGGWSAVLRVPATLTEEDWVATLLDRDAVLVHPGYFFDFPREAFLVVSLLTEPAILVRGLERLLARAATSGPAVL